MYQTQSLSKTEVAKSELIKFLKECKPLALVLYCLLGIACYAATMVFGVVAVLWVALILIPLYAIQVTLWCTKG